MIAAEQYPQNQRAEEHGLQIMSDAFNSLQSAVEQDDAHDMSHLTDEDLFTIQRAITGYGEAVTEKYGIDYKKVVIGSAQLDGVTRQKQFDASPLQQGLADLEVKDLNVLLDDEEQTPHDLVVKGLNLDETLTYSNASNLGLLWEDIYADKAGKAFMSAEVDSATYIIAARSLAEMQESADPFERKAAIQALNDMRAHAENTMTERVAMEPESLRRVRIARVLGPKAGDMAVASVVRRQLMHVV